MKPADQKIENLLRKAAVPDRSADYWKDFPFKVISRLGGKPAIKDRSRIPAPVWRWGLALAAGCAVVICLVKFQGDGHSRITTSDLARYQNILREVENVFPRQVRAVVLDDQGAQVVLAEVANVAPADPLWVEISRESSRRTILTFSGQQARVGEEMFEFLSDARGHVIVLGSSRVWREGESTTFPDGVRIRARVLEASL